MGRLRFLGAVAVAFVFGWVPPELIAWLRDAPLPSRRRAGQRIGKKRRVARRDRND